jgi:hypothetical protein
MRKITARDMPSMLARHTVCILFLSSYLLAARLRNDGAVRMQNPELLGEGDEAVLRELHFRSST